MPPRRTCLRLPSLSSSPGRSRSFLGILLSLLFANFHDDRWDITITPPRLLGLPSLLKDIKKRVSHMWFSQKAPMRALVMNEDICAWADHHRVAFTLAVKHSAMHDYVASHLYLPPPPLFLLEPCITWLPLSNFYFRQDARALFSPWSRSFRHAPISLQDCSICVFALMYERNFTKMPKTRQPPLRYALPDWHMKFSAQHICLRIARCYLPLASRDDYYRMYFIIWFSLRHDGFPVLFRSLRADWSSGAILQRFQEILLMRCSYFGLQYFHYSGDTSVNDAGGFSAFAIGCDEKWQFISDDGISCRAIFISYYALHHACLLAACRPLASPLRYFTIPYESFISL